MASMLASIRRLFQPRPTPVPTVTRSSSPEERARSGARILDAYEPAWPERIDCTRLNMLNPWRCVLAQVYGDYHQGLRALGIDVRDNVARSTFAITHGFSPGFDDGDRLAEAWIAEAQARLQTD